MKNNDDELPVLNLEESQAGDSLIDKSGDESNQDEQIENENEQTENEDDSELGSFDPNMFAREEENTEEEKTEEKNDSDEFVWPDLDEKENESDTKENQEQPETSEQQEETKVSDSQFKLFTKELGLEADSIEEIRLVLEDLVEENRLLKEATKETVTNKKIVDLEKFSKLDDESLVRRSLEADGLTGAQLEKALDRYLDSGLIDVEAIKIRNNIGKAIQGERQAEIDAKQNEQATQSSERQATVQAFSEFMQGTDSLYGFKLTGNSEKLPEVRRQHTEYVTSGKYLSEITASEKSLAESSWLWRNREVLKTALINNGRQSGRAEILNQIGVPDKTNTTRFTNPESNGEFDPKRFLLG